MSPWHEKGIEGSGMRAKRAGGVAVFGNPPNSVRPFKNYYFITQSQHSRSR